MYLLVWRLIDSVVNRNFSHLKFFFAVTKSQAITEAHNLLAILFQSVTAGFWR